MPHESKRDFHFEEFDSQSNSENLTQEYDQFQNQQCELFDLTDSVNPFDNEEFGDAQMQIEIPFDHTEVPMDVESDTVELSSFKHFVKCSMEMLFQYYVFRRSLSGSHGEWTMDDDRGKVSQRSPDLKAIAQLSQQIAQLGRRMNVPGAARVEKTVKKARKNLNSANTSVGKALDVIHPAVDGYLQAVLRPSDRNRPKVGIPRFPSTRSFIARGFVDVNIVTGQTPGIGFLMINPAICSDNISIAYSSGAVAYIGTSFPSMNALPAGTTGLGIANLPFTTVNLGASALAGRVVGMGVEVQSMTNSLTEQGLVQMLIEPNHGSIAGLTPATMSLRTETQTLPIKKGELYSFAVHPISQTDGDYTSTTGIPYNTSAAAGIAGIMFSGCGASSHTFLARITIDVEYEGSLIENSSTTKSVPPAGAFEHVVSIVGKVHSHHSTKPTMKPSELLSIGRAAYKLINSPAGRAGVRTMGGLMGLVL